MEKHIVCKPFGKVAFFDENGDGSIKEFQVCPKCQEPAVDGYWYLKGCPNDVLVDFECNACHTTWVDLEVTSHNMDLSSFCKEEK